MVSRVQCSVHPLGESTDDAEMNLTEAGPSVRRPTLTMAFRHRMRGGGPLSQIAVPKRVIERKATRDRKKQDRRQAGNATQHSRQSRPRRVMHLVHASTAARRHQETGGGALSSIEIRR